VEVDEADWLSGPAEDVVGVPGMAGTGGLETSALALGQARAALVKLEEELRERQEEPEAFQRLCVQWEMIAGRLVRAAAGEETGWTGGELRRRANALVLGATQAALTARKGSGFLRSDPAQRWARQALFFLVWSCPRPVAEAAMRDLAGLCEG
jgi:hypothetical protein